MIQRDTERWVKIVKTKAAARRSDRDALYIQKMERVKWMIVVGCLPVLAWLQIGGLKSRQLVRMTDVENVAPHWIGTEKIVFESNRDGHWQLYTAAKDGSNQLNISNHAFNDYQVAVSPDGKWLCFVSDRDGDPDLYVMRLVDMNVSKVTAHPGAELFPAFSRKTGRIYFNASLDSLGGQDIYSVRLDGQDLRRVTRTTEDETAVSVSPDGRKALALQRGKGSYSEDIVVIDLETGRVTNLTNSLATEGWPSWSLDGTHIFFSSDRSAGTFNLFKMASDGSGVEQLTYISPPFMDTRPQVSQDGRKLLFNREIVGKNGRNTCAVYVMDLK